MATDARSANRNYPVPHTDNLISEDFLRLITALGMIDTDIDSLFTSMSGKASESHTHPISEIDELQGALDGKAAAGHTHALGDLNNVSTSGAAAAQYLGFTGSGWQPITIQISHVSGLQGALDGKADAASLGTAALLDAGAGIGNVPVVQGGGKLLPSLIPEVAQPFIDVASAATTDIGAVASVNVRIIGTVTITGLGTAAEGVRRNALFAASLTLTHNVTSLINLTGADITTAAGDIAVFVSEGSGNWRMVDYVRADGTALVAFSSPAVPKAVFRIIGLGGTPIFQILHNDLGTLSVSRTGAGRYGISWTNSLTTTRAQLTAQRSGSAQSLNAQHDQAPGSTSLTVAVANEAGSGQDPDALEVVIWGAF